MTTYRVRAWTFKHTTDGAVDLRDKIEAEATVEAKSEASACLEVWNDLHKQVWKTGRTVPSWEATPIAL